MRVLIISAAYPPANGGVATHVSNLSHELLKIDKKEGIVVNVITKSEKQKTHYPIQEGAKFQVFKLESDKTDSFSSRRAPFEKILKPIFDNWRQHSIRSDIIHTHDIDSTYMGLMLKVAFNIPLVMTVHRAPIDWKKNKHRENPKDCFMEALKNFKLVDKLIVPSHCSKEVLIQQGYDASSIKVIHHGINYSYLASFTNLPFLDQLLPQNQKVEIILCPARADEHKDPETFIRAASILKEKIKDQKLFFILTAKSTKMFKLEEFAKSLELQVGKGKDILIEEFKRNEMPTLYRRAKACVISSRRESFCQVVLESFLYKTPVVASNNTALKELIEHEENGMLFDTGSSNDLATQVEKILNDNGIREHIIKGGEKSLNDKYNSEIMAKNYMSLYQEVIDESQK